MCSMDKRDSKQFHESEGDCLLRQRANSELTARETTDAFVHESQPLG